MNIKIRLFLAGSVGALCGGALTHYKGGSTLMVLLWLMIGAVIAAFIYSPKEAAGEAVTAAKQTCAYFYAYRKDFMSTALSVIKFMLAAVLIITLALIVGLSWGAVAKYTVGSIMESFSVVFGEACFIISMLASCPFWRALEKKRFTTRCVLIALSLTPLGVVYWALRLAWTLMRAALWILIRIPLILVTILVAALVFVALLLVGLNKCSGRSAAMCGSSVGILVGLFWWNPFIVGAVGGIGAVGVQHLSQHFNETMINLFGSIFEGLGNLVGVLNPRAKTNAVQKQ